MKDDFEDLEKQLRQFSAKPLTPAFQKRVLGAAARPSVNHWQKYVFWPAAAAAVALVLLLSLQKAAPIHIATNAEPLKGTSVLKPMVTQSATSNLPIEMKTDIPVANGKELLNAYYLLLAKNQPVQQKAIVAKENVSGTQPAMPSKVLCSIVLHPLVLRPMVLRPLVLREIRVISTVKLPSTNRPWGKEKNNVQDNNG